MTGTFWTWIVEAYARPGVAEAFLTLQDRDGIDIVTLMFCCWRAANGQAIDAATADGLSRLVDEWTKPIVAPVRAARRALKTSPHLSEAERGDIRRQVQATELALERLHVNRLEALFAADDGASGARPSAALANANAALYLQRRQTQAASPPDLLQSSEWRAILQALELH